MAINDTDLLPLGRNGQVYKIEVSDLTTHQKTTFIEVDGDTMQGSLKTIPPVSDTDATNKVYVDTKVQEVVDQLNDLADLSSEGVYNYKTPGANGSPAQPPGVGEYYFVNSATLDYTPLYEDADQIYIDHHTAIGNTNNLVDVKVGEYLQFNIATTADSVTYIVDAINSQTDYTIFTLSFNRKTSDTVIRPADGQQARLQSYHIEGIDVDDLNATLDTRYVSTSGDTVSGSIALGTTSVRSNRNTLRVLADGPNGVLRALNYVESGYIDKTDDNTAGVKLNAIGVIDIQRPATDADNSVVFDLRQGTTQNLKITLDGEVTASKFYGDGSNLINLPTSSLWEENGNTISPIKAGVDLSIAGDATILGAVQFDIGLLPSLP